MAHITVKSDESLFFQIIVDDKTGELTMLCVLTKDGIDVEAKGQIASKDGRKIARWLIAAYEKIEG